MTTIIINFGLQFKFENQTINVQCTVQYHAGEYKIEF
jgi:hypothetical protein